MASLKRIAFFGLIVLLGTLPLFAQPANTGGLRGQVTDPSGAVVVGASITVTGAGGVVQKAVSDKQGYFLVRGIPAGAATVDAASAGFTPYNMPNVIIPAGDLQKLDIALGVAGKSEQVTVQSETTTVDVNPANNASATVLKEKDLEALSDDPDELQQDLLALAGPSAGPNGGQIYIDGFSGGTLPPKSSIREIRINQNAFSASYDRPGFGRVEVFTKPGTDSWHGQFMFGARNKVLNARNPYASTDVPDYHTERYSGNISGALGKKASMFLNIEQRDIQELNVTNAATLDNLGQAVTLQRTEVAPENRTIVSPRFDVQLTPANTLSARYQYLRNVELNQGFGNTTLPERGDNYHQDQHTLQISDTQVLSPQVINETRFQLLHINTNIVPTLADVATVSVLGEFGSGSSLLGHDYTSSSQYELQNYTSLAKGKHFVKFGGRLRISHVSDNSTAEMNGVLTFTQIGADGSTCDLANSSTCLTPLAAYQAGKASQLLIVTGSPNFTQNFADVGLYAEDDWKLRPNLTLSYGLRVESQTSISDKLDWAPRLGLSWGLGKKGAAPKTVVRLGYGIFYDRISSETVLQANRLNGTVQQQSIYTSTASNPILCPAGAFSAAGLPTAYLTSACSVQGSGANTVYELNPHLRAPYTMQVAASLERQLGSIGTVSATYINSRGLHQASLRNANAPYLENYDAAKGNVYQYWSEGIFKQDQLITNVSLRVSQMFSLSGFYALGWAHSETSGASSNPSNSGSMAADYGRASFDIRHRLFLSGTASFKHNIRVSPFVIANSGGPFNIITGSDNNGDSFYNDRPAFASAAQCASGSSQYVSNRYGCFDLAPATGAKLIPINYGNGPANVTVNLRVSKTFGFGPDLKKNASNNQQNQQGGPGGPGGPPGGGRGGPGGGGPGGGFGRGPAGLGSVFGGANTTRKYNLTIAAMARNLFNTWNPGNPIGDLTSSRFGKSTSLAGGPFSSGTANRLFDLTATFTF